MAKPILSEKSEVVLSCHQGLSAREIVYDCMEKARALTKVGFWYLMSGATEDLPAAYMSVIDDILELGLKYGVLADSPSSLIIVK